MKAVPASVASSNRWASALSRTALAPLMIFVPRAPIGTKLSRLQGSGLCDFLLSALLVDVPERREERIDLHERGGFDARIGLRHSVVRRSFRREEIDRKSTRLNSSHVKISYAV